MPQKWAKLGFLFCVSRRFYLDQRGARLLDLIFVGEEAVHRNFQRAGSFPAFRWPERQTRAFLYVTLRYLFLLSQLLQSFANNRKSLQ